MSLPPYFVGRAVELTRIRQAAGSVRAGQPWFVVVEGESGIGKTTLLLRAVSELDDFVVLRAGGVPGRQHEPFAVVRELLTRLPAGLDGPAAAQLPEMAPSVVGGQLLRALVGAERPVAVVVDDVQWVDRESAGALRFLLRQLVNDRVLHIVGYRPVPTGVGGVESVLAEAMRAVGGRQTYLRLSGLAAPEISDLARKVYDTRLSPAAADRIATATGGHPLYVRTLLAEAPTGWVDRLDGRPPMPDSLGMLLRGRVAELPDDTRALLEALAVLDARMPLTVAGRLAGLPDPAVAAQPALDLGLVDSESGGWVAFRHPLVRSAVYEALPVPRRRRLHAAAAGTVDGDAALAHRVAAAEDADGCLAAELDRSARRHGSRGAHILAAEQLLQAAAWSETVADQQRRLLTACVEFLDAFEYRRVYALGEQIERCAPGPLRSFVLAHLAGMTQSSGFADIVAHSRDVLDGPQENTDRDISARAALSVARIYSFTGRWDDAARLAGQAGALANDPGLALRVRCFRSWAIGLTQGPVAGLALLGDEPDIAAMRPVARSELLLARGILRVHTGDFVGARLDLTTAVSRPNGSATLFWWLGHYHLVLLSYLTGAWAECDAYARLVLDMSVVQFADGDAAVASAAMALAPAGRGDVEVAGHWVGRAAGLLTARALSSQATPVRFSEALIARARGDYAAVLAALSEPPDGSWYPLGGAWTRRCSSRRSSRPAASRRPARR